LAFVLIAAGIGLLRHRGWARSATITLLTVNLVPDIAVLPFAVLVGVPVRNVSPAGKRA
jgi:hypothetical protein